MTPFVVTGCIGVDSLFGMGSRVDVWQVKSKEPAQTIECGYAKNYHAKYTQGQVLGRGGFGVVAVVTDKETGREYACKSINKWLEGDVSDKKQARHIGNIRREVAVLRRLRGTLNVAHLKQVYEDNRDVHVVMEYCRGGELWHRIGNKHYAERTVIYVEVWTVARWLVQSKRRRPGIQSCR